MALIHSLGRRKTAVARVYLQRVETADDATIVVNHRDYKNYFGTPALHYKIEQALRAIDAFGQYKVKVNVEGGGMTGQAEAIRLGISRALCEENPENRTTLKPEGFLTRDPRMVERKKFGQKKARKRFQFSKR